MCGPDRRPVRWPSPVNASPAHPARSETRGELDARPCARRKAPSAAWRVSSIVVQDRAEAAILLEQRIAAEPEQVEVERLVGLLLAVAPDFDVIDFIVSAGLTVCCSLLTDIDEIPEDIVVAGRGVVAQDT